MTKRSEKTHFDELRHKDEKREKKEASRYFKIFFLILTMAWVGGTSFGQTFTH